MSTFTPTTGQTFCTVEYGAFKNTMDGSTANNCQFKRGQSCLSEWTWDNPVNVNYLRIHSRNYVGPTGADNYIHAMWGKVDGSWVEIARGTYHLTTGVWYNVPDSACNNCTGIRIGQTHNPGASKPWINEVLIDYEEMPTTSCTASFQETSVEVGATIHANFTWSGAVKRGLPYLHYAVMNIKDPNGSVCASHFELTNSSGSKSLSCVTNMAGTWRCKIEVWQGAFYVPCTDTVSVTEPTPKPTVSFSAYPTTIERGQSSKLTWSTNYATSVKINNVTKSLSGSEYVYPTVTTTYTLVATGDGGTTTKSVTVTVTEPPPSCTASFQETSAKVGDIIHANFTWANAVKRGSPYYHYAVMWIEDPNGDSCVNYFELSNATGSKTLEFKTDMAGTWKCQIDVWQGVYYISCSDTVPVEGTVIGIIDYAVYTEFFTGPFDPKASVIVCKVRAWNTGNMTGQVYADLYEHPGEPAEAPITGVGWILDPKAYGGVAGEHAFEVVVPDDPGGTWPLGIKVFGETESEPPWGSLGTKIFKILRR